VTGIFFVESFLKTFTRFGKIMPTPVMISGHHGKQRPGHGGAAAFHLLETLPGPVIVPAEVLDAASQFAASVDGIKPHRQKYEQQAHQPK
jgi:hypothetical protein